MMEEGENVLQSVKRDRDRGRVIALDIDQCSILGNDTNDILQIISMMTNCFQDEDKEKDVHSVLELLINPQMLVAIQEITRQTGQEPYIVFYTMKSGIVTCCNASESQKQILVDHDLSLDSGTIAFKRGELGEGLEYLYNQLGDATLPECDRQSLVYTLLCRLGIVTWWVSRALGLRYAAPVYLTCKNKNLESISRHLGVDLGQVFLFDDRANEHAAELGLSEGDAHMITTPPFNLSAQSAEQLYKILVEAFPITDGFKQKYPVLIEYASHPSMEMPLDPITKDWRLYSVADEDDMPPWDLRQILRKGS